MGQRRWSSGFLRLTIVASVLLGAPLVLLGATDGRSEFSIGMYTLAAAAAAIPWAVFGAGWWIADGFSSAERETRVTVSARNTEVLDFAREHFDAIVRALGSRLLTVPSLASEPISFQDTIHRLLIAIPQQFKGVVIGEWVPLRFAGQCEPMDIGAEIRAALREANPSGVAEAHFVAWAKANLHFALWAQPDVWANKRAAPAPDPRRLERWLLKRDDEPEWAVPMYGSTVVISHGDTCAKCGKTEATLLMGPWGRLCLRHAKRQERWHAWGMKLLGVMIWGLVLLGFATAVSYGFRALHTPRPW